MVSAPTRLCRRAPVACPFFIPSEPHERELWPHRTRLSLGDGFAGHCAAHAPESYCDEATVRSHCNLGYAAACVHLPAERAFDAIRFLVQSENVQRERFQGSTVLRVQFACERAHQPALAGELRYHQPSKTWLDQPDPRLLRLADAAVRAWIGRHTAIVPRGVATDSTLQASKAMSPSA
jgi:hypothetical protein